MESHPLQDGARDTDTAELQHAKLSRSVACLLAETATLGSNLAHAAPTDGTVSGLEQIDSDLGTYFSHTYELGQRLKRQTFTVAVLALAKSGERHHRLRRLLSGKTCLGHIYQIPLLAKADACFVLQGNPRS